MIYILTGQHQYRNSFPASGKSSNQQMIANESVLNDKLNNIIISNETVLCNGTMCNETVLCNGTMCNETVLCNGTMCNETVLCNSTMCKVHYNEMCECHDAIIMIDGKLGNNCKTAPGRMIIKTTLMLRCFDIYMGYR